MQQLSPSAGPLACWEQISCRGRASHPWVIRDTEKRLPAHGLVPPSRTKEEGLARPGEVAGIPPLLGGIDDPSSLQSLVLSQSGPLTMA
jgi:hypothetical protein